MKLQELLRSECIRVGSTADDKALALCDIAALAKQSPLLADISEEAILEALQDRETLGATAFGIGVAIPHCRMKNVEDFVVGLMTIPRGVDFESDDHRKVKLVVFIIAPRYQDNTHIRLLSAISQALQDEVSVQAMIAAADADALRTAFLQAAGQDISERLPTRRNLIEVFVQDDKVFRQILASLTELENCSLTVVETTGAHQYLNLSGSRRRADSAAPNGKMIAVIIQRRLSNEVIRRIESVTGSLMECTGVMVTVQELDYSAGSLEA
jgi:nitrogen PTS system EIIA component